ncbi:MAG: M15 family metallopeptidase [Spirochaetaceae bacterium]|jgi:D-alanyl-D-alanine carboxypeptidase|nr:M15 family metallopeptidase [Spirochaetaceae bacterium]
MLITNMPGPLPCPVLRPLLRIVLLLLLILSSCTKGDSRNTLLETETTNSASQDGRSAGSVDPVEQYLTEGDSGLILDDFLDRILKAAEIPPDVAGKVSVAAAAGPSFILDLLTCLSGEPGLRTLVDKEHALPGGYEPVDLVELGNGSCQVSRKGLLLRRMAAESLEEMAAAALAGGVTLVASSAYRSYAYQEEVYARNVRESGQEAADRESARPGRSQHQTGLAVDFGSIDDSFAETPAGLWMAANAGRFGWSLSFPDGYEEVTGYRWESWHYRYVGRDLVSFIDTYFGGIQQYALRFIYEWERAE